MKSAELSVQSRDVSRKSATKSLRRLGFVPANLYGAGTENLFCAFDSRDLDRILKQADGANILITLKSEDSQLKGKKVILKSLERDPVKWRPLHADFYVIDPAKPLDVKIPLEYVGVASGVKLGGGILQIIRRSVEVRALPDHLPEKIEVDVSGLDLNQSLHISDLNVSEQVQILDSEKFTIVSVAEQEEEKAPGAASGEAAASEAEAKAS